MKAERVPETVIPIQADDDGRHFAQFSDATVHFTMTTHAGGPFDLNRAVRRLLAADLAVAAAWPSESDVRVTPSLRRLTSSLRNAERLKEDFLTVQDEKTFRSISRLVLRHPSMVGRNLVRRRKLTATEAEVEGEADAGLSSLDEAVEFGTDVVAGAQTIAAVERTLDAGLFGGRSRDEDEFVRLTLRGSYHDIRLPGTDETFYVVFEPRLIIHSSGAVQLTIAMPVDRELTTPQLVQLSRSDRAVIAKSQMAEPLLKGLPARQLRGRWLDELDAGARLREMVFDEKVTMAESLERYLIAVGAAIGKRIPREWNTYATLFATAGECCETAQWPTEHQEDLARITTRYNNGGRIHHDKLTGKNFSLNPDSILISNQASTTRIQTQGEPPAPIEHLNTVLLIEHVLLQYFRLRSLEDAVSSSNLFGARLQSVQNEAVAVFSAMRQYEIRYGSAREIATHLLADLGGDDIRRTIETALGLAAQANATRDASIQARRSLALTWVGTVLAVLVAIPTLSELLDLVRETPEGSTLAGLLTPLMWVANFGAWGPWLVVLALLIGAIGWWLLKLLWALCVAAWRGALRVGGRGQRVPRQFVLHVDVQERSSLLDQRGAAHDAGDR